ncbi:DNA-binding IclR family transcriptional regulator [Nonomuraea soli]|uniref:DNA-binding IclR family transcriptional regulator n=2 Tax=Nonomuraea soli TaxID=1032476 RepID=A0A7W0CHF0_9ACTN|nr:DNA-binding IclR family transcriptional regulator [Nonomuraea soli]
MTLQELHEELEIPIGSMHRLLAALVDEQYVTRSPHNRRYFLGSAAAELVGPSAAAHSSLVPAPELLVRASKESGETVFLTSLTGSRIVCISIVEATHPLRLFVQLGQELPWHAAAAARSVLAYLPQDTVEAIVSGLEFNAYTPGTPKTPEEVLAHLAEIRSRGYDVCENELDENVWAVAAPVFTSTGVVVASVTLAAAGHRMRDPIRRVRATEIVLRTARAMSEELGHETQL